MMISNEDINELGLTEDDIIKIIMKVTDSDRATAEFIYAIETGKVDGDIIAVDSDGNEINSGKSISSIKTE
jgi:hypothetical protein